MCHLFNVEWDLLFITEESLKLHQRPHLCIMIKKQGFQLHTTLNFLACRPNTMFYNVESRPNTIFYIVEHGSTSLPYQQVN